MKYIKLLIIAAFLSTMFTGCSYVSDMVEGAITERASFGATAVYSGGNVIVSWDKEGTGTDFTGIEIYRTSKPNDEYASYDVVASRLTAGAVLANNTLSYTYTPVPALTSGKTYFFRVGFIKWDQPAEKRDAAHGYIGNDTNDYNAHTEIDAISGYAKLTIP